MIRQCNYEYVFKKGRFLVLSVEYIRLCSVTESGFSRSGRLSFAYEPITEDTPQEAYRKVLEQAGCSLVRDDYDNEIISQIKRGVSPYGNNGFIDTPAQAGGWPELRKGTSLLDSDDDGMPDEWEKKHHLNPQDASDASSFTLNRYYTNVEMYMNSLIEGPVD